MYLRHNCDGVFQVALEVPLKFRICQLREMFSVVRPDDTEFRFKHFIHPLVTNIFRSPRYSKHFEWERTFEIILSCWGIYQHFRFLSWLAFIFSNLEVALVMTIFCSTASRTLSMTNLGHDAWKTPFIAVALISLSPFQPPSCQLSKSVWSRPSECTVLPVFSLLSCWSRARWTDKVSGCSFLASLIIADIDITDSNSLRLVIASFFFSWAVSRILQCWYRRKHFILKLNDVGTFCPENLISDMQRYSSFNLLKINIIPL